MTSYTSNKNRTHEKETTEVTSVVRGEGQNIIIADFDSFEGLSIFRNFNHCLVCPNMKLRKAL